MTYLEDLRKYVVLHVRVVHSHGAASDFCPIQHKVVVLPTYLIQIAQSRKNQRPKSVGSRLASKTPLEMRTSATWPLYIFSTSCHIGAVKG